MDKLQFKNDGTVERVAFTAEEEAARNADIIRVKEEDDARIAARQIIANGTDIKTAILAIKSDAQVSVVHEDLQLMQMILIKLFGMMAIQLTLPISKLRINKLNYKQLMMQKNIKEIEKKNTQK